MVRKIIGLIGLGLYALSIGPSSTDAQRFFVEPVRGTTAKKAEMTQQMQHRNAERASAHSSVLKHTYRLHDLDSRETGLVIAREEMKVVSFNRWSGLIIEGAADGHTWPSPPEVKALLSSILQIQISEAERKDGMLILEATTRMTLEAAGESIALLMKNRDLVREMVGIRALANQASREIESLQNRPTPPGDNADIQAQYAAASNRLRAADWHERARYLTLQGEIQKSIDAYTAAVDAFPGLAAAYRNRGRHYLSHLEDKPRAIEDFNRALTAYGAGARDRLARKEYQACIENTEAALALNGKYAEAYFFRGACRVGLGDQEGAKTDFAAAARLGDKRAQDLLTKKEDPLVIPARIPSDRHGLQL